MGTAKPKRILIAPLDWGMGHLTRCIPLIRFLTDQGHEVIVAGNNSQQLFLGKIFPNITTWQLDGYNVKYSRRGSTMIPAIISQVPKLIQVIKSEQSWLRQKMAQEPVDGIISDNRYGIYHPQIPSIIISHQLQVQTGMGQIADQYLRRLHYRVFKNFDEVWVPDVADTKNLSGTLGHPSVLPVNTKYIGLLSPYQPVESRPKNEYLLILLSGPEPQRSILSEMLWKQTLRFQGKIVFVEGSNEAPPPRNIPEHVSWHKRLTPQELQPIMENATCVVSRSGYSTIMDLIAFNKKGILIPTPGQTEQLYLAKYLAKQGLFTYVHQRKISLVNAFEQVPKSNTSNYFPIEVFQQYQPILKNWLARL